jgi:hypothetical protein
MEIRMRLAHFLRLSTLLVVVSAAGCGGSAPPPATASATTTDASTSDAFNQSKTKGKRVPVSRGKQTIEKRREYNAASPDGPPSKY